MAYGMITGSIGVVGQNPALNSTPQAGGTAVSNLSMVGGIITGSSRQFVSLPVAGQSNVLGLPTNALGTAGNYALSSSFAGVSGSIIQALNFLKAGNDTAGDVTFLEVNQALQEATGSVHLGRAGGTDAVLGGANFNIGVEGDVDLMHLNANMVSVSGTLSASLGIDGDSLKISNNGHLGNVAVTDLIQLQSDGDIIIKNGAYDFDIASHDGTNGLLLGGTLVSATAAELNYVDITTLGTAEASKALTIAADDTWTVAGMTAANLGTVTTVEINGGSLDNATVGATTPSSGKFTTLSGSAAFTVQATIAAQGAISSESTISGNSIGVSSGMANILGSGAIAGVSLSASSDITGNGFKMAGTNAAGGAKVYRLSVVGGILLVDEDEA